MITPLVPSPGKTAPTFKTWVESLLEGKLSTAIDEINVAITALNFNSTNGSSSTSVAIGLGNKSVTADTGKSWLPGMTIRFANNASNWMQGEIDSYNPSTGALQFLATLYRGSGTYASWSISMAATEPEGSMVFLGSVEAASSAQVDIEDSFDEYDLYRIVATGIHYAVDASIGLRCRLKIGGSYDTGANYLYSVNGAAAGGATGYIQLANDIAGTGGVHANFIMDIFKPSSSLPKTLICNTVLYNGTTMGDMVRANHSGASALTGIRIYPTLNNLTGGKFSLYGVRNA